MNRTIDTDTHIDDTEGHALRGPSADADVTDTDTDTEGHALRGPSADADVADTEGHGIRGPGGDADDTEGHVIKFRG